MSWHSLIVYPSSESTATTCMSTGWPNNELTLSACWLFNPRDLYVLCVFISPYSVAFGVILSLLFVFCLFFVFFCLYGWGYLNAGCCDRREILAQGRANTRDGNEVVRGWSAHGGPWGGGLNFYIELNGEILRLRIFQRRIVRSAWNFGSG